MQLWINHRRNPSFFLHLPLPIFLCPAAPNAICKCLLLFFFFFLLLLLLLLLLLHLRLPYVLFHHHLLLPPILLLVLLLLIPFLYACFSPSISYCRTPQSFITFFFLPLFFFLFCCSKCPFYLFVPILSLLLLLFLLPLPLLLPFFRPSILFHHLLSSSSSYSFSSSHSSTCVAAPTALCICLFIFFFLFLFACSFTYPSTGCSSVLLTVAPLA